jgi:type IV/VI secretion system ImpK/VasF family protein
VQQGLLKERKYYDMKNKQWEAIHEIYTRMEKLCGRSLYIPEETLYAGTGEQQKPEDIQRRAEAVSYTADDVVHIRAELRTQLDFLRAALAEHYSERDTYIILFAVVAQIDELIQAIFLRTMNISWPLLQKELFQIDNAGDVFFDILDDIMLKPQTYTFIYEVYYFCLRYGFRGRYENNPVKLTEYKKKLQAKLTQDEPSFAPAETEETGKIRQFGAPYWNYLIMAGVLVAAYLLFMFLGRYP